MGKSILPISAVGILIEEALNKYIADKSNTLITDIHLQLNPNLGELTILNDDDMILSESIVEEWIGDFGVYSAAAQFLRNALIDLKERGKLETLNLIKPYSFVLIDKDKETVEELLLVDDNDTLLLHDELLKGLDDELNTFLKELLEK